MGHDDLFYMRVKLYMSHKLPGLCKMNIYKMNIKIITTMPIWNKTRLGFAVSKMGHFKKNLAFFDLHKSEFIGNFW